MAAGFRLFLIVGLPIIAGLFILSLILYLLFPEQFRECCPCVIQRKPIVRTEIIEVPVCLNDTKV